VWIADHERASAVDRVDDDEAAAREALEIAHAGLARRARLDGQKRDESVHLAPLERIAAEGLVPAQAWIARFNGAWGGRVEPAFQEATI